MVQSVADGAADGIETLDHRCLFPFGRFSAPRDDTARASCGNGAKANSYHFIIFAREKMKLEESDAIYEEDDEDF